MKSYLPLILGMMLVTYIPRLLPLLIITERPLHPFFKKFLLFIPYTALSVLITRGMMEASGGMQFVTFVGLGAAAICSWFKGGLVLSVFVAIIASFLSLQLGASAINI
ncbi:MAG: branched-chain amino acid transporter [Clostridia bacterium]|jgi:branched-subunit amino acid transport protein|nr:branched-chain amino acid transporter [Clostridia bacterium]